MSDKTTQPLTHQTGFTNTGTSVYPANEMSEIIFPLEQSQLGHTELFGWTITLTPDGLGLIVEAPEGKVIDFANSRFGFKLVGFKPDARRLEVRCK